VKTLGLNLVHFIGNRVITVAGQTIDAGSHQEVRPELWAAQKARRCRFRDRRYERTAPAQRAVLSPASCSPTGCFPSSRRQPQGDPFHRHRQARMHQNSAHRVRPQSPSLVASTVDSIRQADRVGLLSLK
jgi:hypothetical protein